MVFTTRKESPKMCKKILLHEDILEHRSIQLIRWNDDTKAKSWICRQKI